MTKFSFMHFSSTIRQQGKHTPSIDYRPTKPQVSITAGYRKVVQTLLEFVTVENGMSKKGLLTSLIWQVLRRQVRKGRPQVHAWCVWKPRPQEEGEVQLSSLPSPPTWTAVGFMAWRSVTYVCVAIGKSLKNTISHSQSQQFLCTSKSFNGSTGFKTETVTGVKNCH